jgi:aminopeptidase-like protein
LKKDELKLLNPKIIENYFDRLWPIMRSITGEGYKLTHDIIGEIVKLDKISFKSGTKVYDWEIPLEWHYNSAYIIDPNGKKIVDASVNNLHVINYSAPINTTLTLDELKPHIHYLKEMPDAIPYVTSYYERNWGFCMSYNMYKKLIKGKYNVVIDTDFKKGELFVSEAYLPGKEKKEIFFSSYTCHPSLANNELSGPLVLMFLYDYLSKQDNRVFSYRFLFSAETIGTIAYLSKRLSILKKNMKAGYVLTCIGDNNSFQYKRSKTSESIVNRAAEKILKNTDVGLSKTHNFFPWGSDERQFCSPGINLPVGCITRTMYGDYPEYHTSEDNKDLIDFDAICETIKSIVQICDIIETNCVYISQKPFCEPFLSKYNLYDKISQTRINNQDTNAIRWVLSYADGKTDLLTISSVSNIEYETIYRAVKICLKNNLIIKV